MLSHATIAPAVVDPILIRELSAKLLDKSPIHLPVLSSHPKRKALVPLIGLETGSVRMAKQVMPSKGAVSDRRMAQRRHPRAGDLNKYNWFPAMTLIIGNPGETDDDSRATLDLIYEVERRGLFAFFIPSIFTPLHDTRMERRAWPETAELSPLQWQLMMKCWKMNLRPGQNSWWGPTAWRVGALGLWAKTAQAERPGPLMFANAIPESLMARMGKIYIGKPMA